jgi:hypothetical protein
LKWLVFSSLVPSLTPNVSLSTLFSNTFILCPFLQCAHNFQMRAVSVCLSVCVVH